MGHSSKVATPRPLSRTLSLSCLLHVPPVPISSPPSPFLPSFALQAGAGNNDSSQAKKGKKDNRRQRRRHQRRGRGVTPKAVSPKWSCCLPACVRWIEYDFIFFFYFQKLKNDFQRKKKHPQQRKSHSIAQHHGTTTRRSTTEHSTAQQATTTHQSSTTTPQNANGDTTTHSDTLHLEVPTTVQTKPAPNNTMRCPTQHRTHRERTQTNSTSKGKRTAGHHCTAPDGDTAPQNTGHSTGERGTQQTTAHSRAASHAARQEHPRQHTQAENNSRQPDAATNSRQ